MIEHTKFGKIDVTFSTGFALKDEGADPLMKAHGKKEIIYVIICVAMHHKCHVPCCTLSKIFNL